MLIKDLEKPIWHAKELKVLYHLNYWDGALSGILLKHSDQQKYYFKCVLDTRIKIEHDDDYLNWLVEKNIISMEDTKLFKIEYEQHRTYAIFKLNEEQLSIIEENHQLFQEHVGYHTDWDHRWNKVLPHPRSEWDKFYKNDQKREAGELLGELVGFTTNQELYDSVELNGQYKEE